MQVLLTTIFLFTYLAVILENPLRINKSASALVGAGVLWIVFASFSGPVSVQLHETLISTAQIVFFLMGAMTIVELIDGHDGFLVVTQRIKTQKLSSLLWLTGLLTFFLSAIIDNMTASIVMVSLMKKLIGPKEDRLFFAGIIVIAANAGGAWSPIGDVTTTMLWIGGQITAGAIMKGVFLPSLVNALVPLIIISYWLRGRMVVSPAVTENDEGRMDTTPFERNFIFFMGIGILCAVPFFKAVTNLPPFMGILLGLGILWLTGELIQRKKNDQQKERLTVASALQRIDMPSLIFFIGILFAVATLEHSHLLKTFAAWLGEKVGNQAAIVFFLGLASSVVDNVPLVAASMGMYPLTEYPTDSFLWEYLTYAAGTGGSILVIGSAAGVAAMGIEKIEFFWYVRKISLLALIGYICGAVVYILQH